MHEGGRHVVYTVRGDSGSVFGKVKTGFTRRGWTAAKSTNTGLAAMAVRTLIVNKGAL